MKVFLHFLAFVCILVLGIVMLGQLAELREQQRQIDQLCFAMPSALQSSIPPEERKCVPFTELEPGEYDLYFANYKEGRALLVYHSYEKEQRYDGKIHFVYAIAIPDDILKSWETGEERKIPLE